MYIYAPFHFLICDRKQNREGKEFALHHESNKPSGILFEKPLEHIERLDNGESRDVVNEISVKIGKEARSVGVAQRDEVHVTEVGSSQTIEGFRIRAIHHRRPRREHGHKGGGFEAEAITWQVAVSLGRNTQKAQHPDEEYDVEVGKALYCLVVPAE